MVTYSRMVHECLAVAERLEQENISVEVVDLRTISPLDRTTILASVKKTSRLVVVHEAVTDFGVGAEVVATVAENGFWFLDAPIERVGAGFSPAPYAPNLEREWLPDQEQIAQAIRRTVSI
ncbi:MAG: transketolase C-terminal domain-containing protein [Actinomycetota bacterium]